MYFKELLSQIKISCYRLSKESGVPMSTVHDIYSGKTRLEKCSGETLYKLSKVLNISIEKLIEETLNDTQNSQRLSFEVYKSNICHLVKDKGDIDFLIDVLETDEVNRLYNRKWFPEAFYLLGMIDYLSRENNIPICTKYNDLRTQKLPEPIYPSGILIYDEIMQTDMKKKSLEEAIPEFLRFNIIECDIRNLY